MDVRKQKKNIPIRRIRKGGREKSNEGSKDGGKGGMHICGRRKRRKEGHIQI
jgi:hypothetical protein